MFVGKDRSLTYNGASGRFFPRVGLLSNKFAWDKHSSLFCSSVRDKKKRLRTLAVNVTKRLYSSLTKMQIQNKLGCFNIGE